MCVRACVRACVQAGGGGCVLIVDNVSDCRIDFTAVDKKHAFKKFVI